MKSNFVEGLPQKPGQKNSDELFSGLLFLTACKKQMSLPFSR